MQNRNLFLCNTVYQLMVAVWIKHRYMENIPCDLIITNHMNNAETIAERIRMIRCFDDVFFSKTLDEARYRIKRTKIRRIFDDVFPICHLKRYVKCKNKYTDLYVANFDGFTQILFNSLSHNNKLRLHLYEDGISTYCLFEKYYNDMKDYYGKEGSDIKAFLKKGVYRKYNTYNNLNEILVFNPQIMTWNPGCQITELDKIDTTDIKYKKIINEVFDYEKSKDRYDCKYIYFEESFFADGYEINDVELIKALAEQIGKENIMIKIHPRNPKNRFEKLGFRTNKDTSIPWEVILLNIKDVKNKVFITIASQAILNPIMIFGFRIKAYSLYPCLKNIPATLQGEAWEFLYGLFKTYSDMIKLCNDIKMIN